ncbi:MAG: hypothetical protein JXB62_01245 [Pirellulales bacterium]|nr:hypothetical protein [Pirellulales bacterium]
MPDAEPEKPRPPFQFSLAGLLLVTVMVSVLAAAFGGMLRAHAGSLSTPPGVYRLMAVVSPLAVLIVVSLWYSAVRWFKRRGR